MARFVGIDVGTTQVRVAIIRGTAKKFSIEKLLAFERLANTLDPNQTKSAEALIAEASNAIGVSNDPLSFSFDGTKSFIRQLEVPSAVKKKLGEMLLFELEAQLPFDIDDAVYDFRDRPSKSTGNLTVTVVAAQLEEVRQSIENYEKAFGRSPDHIVPGAFALAELLPAIADFRSPGIRAIVDLGYNHSEFLIMDGQDPIYSRTISRGISGFPQAAKQFIRELRQTLTSYLAMGHQAPEKLFITGGGALIRDLPRWLAHELSVPVEPLPIHTLAGLSYEQQPDGHRFVRAIGVALAGQTRRKGFDLRKGPLAFERGYGFLRDRIPLLVGLAASILVAFSISTWARIRNVRADERVIDSALETATKEVFGESTTSLERVQQLLAAKPPNPDDDPLPYADAMDILMAMSERINSRIKHDLERLEVSRIGSGGFKVNLTAIAPSSENVNGIEDALRKSRCMEKGIVSKRSKTISDNREKYTFDGELRCIEEGGGKNSKETKTSSGKGAN